MDKWLDEYVKAIMDQQEKTNGIFKRRRKDEKR
jgi:hypothetical protein